MPNIRSSEKDVRRIKARTARNKAAKSRVRTLRKKVLTAIASGDTKAAQDAYNNFASAADKAAKNSTLHKNTASRLKSRVAQKLGKTAKA
ncbi:MAG TPA: 30S ribosomal protein S20 [Candidatus Saccharimonadia bacterium]|nr:30S ribosomal protein S20 [Candidatus Saccharimonadia bacterium]